VGGMGYGVLATSFDGRPIKVDGNPGHPLTRGASDAFLQASVLNVYDPDRSRGPVKRINGERRESSWEEFVLNVNKLKITDHLKNAASIVVLAEASRSPSMAALVKAFKQQYPQTQWFEYEAVSADNQREGARQVFGTPLRAVPRLEEAGIIVAVDADLFGPGEPLAIKYSREFAAGRTLRDSGKAGKAWMNRLYVAECGFSITGSMADHRIGVTPGDIVTVLELLRSRLGTGRVKEVVSLDKKALEEFAEAVAKDIQALRPTDMANRRERAVFVAGSRQPAEVHALVALLNAEIKAPVDYYDDGAGADWKPHGEQLNAFAAAIQMNSVIIFLGTNPVLTAPAGMKMEKRIRYGDAAERRIQDKALPRPYSIHIGMYEDETARVCTQHLPLAHFLEAWGDVRTYDGTVSIAQPLIEPIFGAKSALEILSLMLGKNQSGEAIVRETAKNEYMKGRFSEWEWKNALHDGVVAGTALPVMKLATDNLAQRDLAGPAKGLELALYVGAAHDGRYANNGWLMELPDPMTRVNWENPLIMSPKTAIKLGVESDDVVRVKTAACPEGMAAVVYVLPGQPDDVLSLAVGYGRAGLGGVADGGDGKGIGVNAYALRGDAGMFIYDVKVERTGGKKFVACVQDHHLIDKVGRERVRALVPELVVEGTLEEYRKKPALDTRKVVALSMFNEKRYDKGMPGVMAKWGMAIDLTACTGCSACVTACQAENNVPVVGREMSHQGREMHWLRIDRYFTYEREGGAAEEEVPGVVHQPVMCMHCENAPCEEVCPFAATSHSKEGLNMMTYNRCVGTRYCSNNCPYKVRRFNFFDYNAGHTSGEKSDLYTPNLVRSDMNELLKMQKNPQVTVRMRGVMEKCTYCVQRIEAARIDLLAANRPGADKAAFADGSVVTACQQACPTEAIVFGDLNDPASRVSKLHALAHSYGLLDTELNTKPRTEYLAKVKNKEIRK
jgi:Fe-S-cluster-containing dehydrogenase component